MNFKRTRCLSFAAICCALTPCSGLAVVFEMSPFDNWGGVSRIEISQAAYDAGMGTASDILSFVLNTALFGPLTSADPSAFVSGSFSLTPDKAHLLAGIDALTFVDPVDNQLYMTFFEGAGLEPFRHGVLVLEGSSHHTTHGDWERVPEISSTFPLLAISSVFLWGFARRGTVVRQGLTESPA